MNKAETKQVKDTRQKLHDTITNVKNSTDKARKEAHEIIDDLTDDAILGMIQEKKLKSVLENLEAQVKNNSQGEILEKAVKEEKKKQKEAKKPKEIEDMEKLMEECDVVIDKPIGEGPQSYKEIDPKGATVKVFIGMPNKVGNLRIRQTGPGKILYRTSSMDFEEFPTKNTKFVDFLAGLTGYQVIVRPVN